MNQFQHTKCGLRFIRPTVLPFTQSPKCQIEKSTELFDFSILLNIIFFVNSVIVIYFNPLTRLSNLSKYLSLSSLSIRYFQEYNIGSFISEFNSETILSPSSKISNTVIGSNLWVFCHSSIPKFLIILKSSSFPTSSSVHSQ